MAAYVRYVDPKDVNVLNKYLDKEGVVLIYPEAQQAAQEAGIEDGEFLEEYEYGGGDADVWVDLISNPTYYLFDEKVEA